MSSPNKWTNQSLRAHLGERGFLQGDQIISNDIMYTEFNRGEDELTLAEFPDKEPEVYQDGKPVDPTNIGYRNSQIQHNKALD